MARLPAQALLPGTLSSAFTPSNSLKTCKETMPLSPSESPPPEESKPKKKPAFRRPNFRKPDSSGPSKPTSDPFGFFNRSKEHYTTAATVDRKKQTVNKSGSDDDRDGEDGGGSPPKRRKAVPISDDESGEEGGGAARRRNAAHALSRKRNQQRMKENRNKSPSPSSSTSKPSNSRREASLTPPPQLPNREPTPPPTAQTAPTRRSRSQRNDVIHLSDSEQELPQTVLASRNENAEEDDDLMLISDPNPVKPMSETDKYFAQLEARARQRAAEEQRSSAHPEDHGIRSSASVDPAAVDPIVMIFVTSPIDNTKPLIFKRRMSQSLKEVRVQWCKEQGFTPDQTKDVFFIWKGVKVFDSVSCKAIGLKLNSQGNLLPDEGVVEDKVHFEAVTQEVMDARERSMNSVQEEEEEEEPTLRLTLRAKGIEDFKIKVRPSTKVSDLISAFSKARSVDEDNITLDFDGDDLEPDDKIADTELEDMFAIDVHIS